MKEKIEAKIIEKENVIKSMNMELEEIKKGLKKISLDEYDIESYIIKQCLKMKELKNTISNLQYEIYELMQILKVDNMKGEVIYG